MVTPSQAQGGHQIDCMLPLTPSHPGVHSGNFSLSSSSPTITQTCNFQTFPFLVDVFPLPPHTQHKCFLGLAPCRQTALPSPSPVQRTFKQKKKKFFHNFSSHKFHPKATGVSSPLQSVAGRAMTEPSSLFSTGITGGMIILLGLIIPCLWLQHPTLLHLGATLLAREVLPHSCRCWHFPKLLLERPLAHLTPKKTFSVLAPIHSQQKTPSSPQATSLQPCGESCAQPPSLFPLDQGGKRCYFYESASQPAIGSRCRWKSTHFMF